MMNGENAGKAYTAAIYCRLSEEDRNKKNASDDSESIENQRSLLKGYCAENGWSIYDIYSDDDYTGSDRNRPAFRRMLADAQKKCFDVIVCKTLSRFTRELELVEKYINGLFPIWGIRFVSVVDNVDTSAKGNKKSRQIYGMVNEWFLEDMSDNIRAVLTDKRRNGRFIGAFAPFGYKKDPDIKGHLVIDEDAASTVRLIFGLYISGMGRTAIARELNARDLPTPSGYKLAHGERYSNACTSSPQSRIWRYGTVERILTCETYIGNLVQGRVRSISYKTKKVRPTDRSEWIRVNNTHEPIIDISVWNRAQEILSSRVRPSFSAAEANLFGRKAYCSLCSRLLRTTKQKGRRYLRCSTRYYHAGECPGVMISYSRLCESVLSAFVRLKDRYADMERISDCIVTADRCSSTLDSYIRKQARLRADAGKNAGYMKNLYIDKVSGIISQENYLDLMKTFNAEKERCEAELIRVGKDIVRMKEQIALTGSKEDMIKKYLRCDALTFELVRVFIEKIVVYPKRPYSRETNIEIFWNI